MKTNYQIKKLGEICDFQRGLTYSKKDEVDFSNNVVLRATNIDLNTNTLNFSELKYIDNSFKIPKDKKVSRGSLIICTASGSKSHLGKVALIDDDYDYAFGGFMAQITPKKDVDSKYLFYIFISDAYKKLIDKLSSGVNINNLKFSDLENFEIQLPSLPEQKQIVKVLDETYKKLEKANQNTYKNFNNSKGIFNSYLNDIFTNAGKDWKEKELGNICEVEYGYTEKAKNEGDYRFVRITDTDENGLVTQSNKMYVDSFKDVEKYFLSDGDLLMARTGASAGNVLFFENNEKSVFASYLIRIKFNEELQSKLYWYFSKSNFYWDQVRQLSAGSAQPQFNGGALKRIRLSFPKLISEQKSIIKKLDLISKQTKKLEYIYQSKLSAIEKLRKSILKQAFEGKLVAQERDISLPVPSPYIRNQVHAAIVSQVLKDGGETTEVAVAKYDHLLQEIFGVSLGYQFQTHLFGPFDATIKKLVSSGLSPRNKWFAKRNGMIVKGSNITGLLSRSSNLYRNAQAAMTELARLGITKMNTDKVELLSTICHAIKETKSTEIVQIRNFMNEWQTNNNQTKAQKFSEEQTQKCLSFLLNKKLEQKLLIFT